MFKDYLRLLRVEQWYKNVIIFISIIFSSNLFNEKMVFLTVLGFISLCFISSSSYIINDILDMKKDQNHPEKKNRPLTSGKIKKASAVTLSIILFVVSVVMAYFLSPLFLGAVLTLFIFSQAYTFYVRNIAFLDIIFISINFIIRAISGTFIINYPVSFWVILSTFFLSLFLVSSKRSLELLLKNAKDYRPGFKDTDKKVLNFLSVFSICNVFIFFSIYSILTEKATLLISLPVSIYIVLCFFRDLYSSPEKIRNPEKFIFQGKILLAFLLWVLLIIASFYFLPN